MSSSGSGLTSQSLLFAWPVSMTSRSARCREKDLRNDRDLQSLRDNRADLRSAYRERCGAARIAARLAAERRAVFIARRYSPLAPIKRRGMAKAREILRASPSCERQRLTGAWLSLDPAAVVDCLVTAM